jgi:hypothetical protein
MKFFWKQRTNVRQTGGIAVNFFCPQSLAAAAFQRLRGLRLFVNIR